MININTTVYKTYETEKTAAEGLQEFYRNNAHKIGTNENFHIQGIINDCAVKIIVNNRNAASLQLSTKNGNQQSLFVLKRLATQAYSNTCPIAQICIEQFKMQSDLVIPIITEQFIPPTSPHVRKFNVSAISNYGEIHSANLKPIPILSSVILKKEENEKSYASTIPKAAVEPKASSQQNKKAQSQSVRELNNEIFATRYHVEDPNVSLKAVSCTFEDMLIVKANIELEFVSVKDKVISSMGFVKATNSALNTVEAFGEHCGKTTLINCKITNVTARGEIKLSEGTHAGNVCIQVPQRPVCRIILENATIEELILWDLPTTKYYALHGNQEVIGSPATFNYPSQFLKGSISGKGAGRIEGEPYQFDGVNYIKGIKVEIIGNGTIKKISCIDCMYQKIDASDQVTIEQ